MLYLPHWMKVHKAIVRMHWQDMYYNHLLHAAQALELGAAITKSPASELMYLTALSEAKNKAAQQHVLEGLDRYFVFKEVLSSSSMAAVRNIFDEVGLTMLSTYFFDDDFLNDYMLGSLSRLDMRSAAPLLAAMRDCS